MSRARVKVYGREELRRYMGPRFSRVPRGAVVRLIAVVNGRYAIFEWNGERFSCPARILWRLKRVDGGR